MTGGYDDIFQMREPYDTRRDAARARVPVTIVLERRVAVGQLVCWKADRCKVLVGPRHEWVPSSAVEIPVGVWPGGWKLPEKLVKSA